jgi:hypothetical protein
MKLNSSLLTRPGWIVTFVLVVSTAGAGSFAGPAMLAAAQADVESALHEAISRGNQAQVQAITVRDPTIVSDTAASSYARQLVRTNQGLLDSGAIAIDLATLEWGPVEIGDGTAQVTTFETWRTSYADGPTEFSRDRNVYTLTLDPSGTWKIAGNDHPDGRQRPQIPAPEPPPPDAPPAGPGTSRNWAGYAARGGAFTSVSATWTVPKLSLDSAFGADATWVGIGGLRSRDLIQAGTQQTSTGAGTVTYQAWIEMLPDASHPVPLTVLPGDTINVSIDQQDGDNWLFSIANTTSGQTLQRSVQYTSSLSSAEWIEEAPFARRRILPISDFGTITFSSGSAVRDGQAMTIADLEARSIALVDNAGRRLAVPSPLGLDGTSFSVSRI